MFKKIFLDGEETRWSVNENGQVRNDENGKFLKGTILHTYRYINFRWNKKQKNKSVHRLVAEAFLPNPNNLPYVHHIDGNRLNNKLENLKWVTAKENSQNTNYHKSKDKKEEEIKDEKWLYYKNTIYMVSDMGRLKNTKTGRITRGSLLDCGYYRFSIEIENKRRGILAHRAIFNAFYPDIECEDINHINGIKTDNRLINLEAVTHKENMQKAANETNAWNFKKVIQYDLEGNYIQTFLNASDAARAINVLPSSLRNAIRLREGKCKNFIFKRLENEESSSTIRKE